MSKTARCWCDVQKRVTGDGIRVYFSDEDLSKMEDFGLGSLQSTPGLRIMELIGLCPEPERVRSALWLVHKALPALEERAADGEYDRIALAYDIGALQREVARLIEGGNRVSREDLK